MTADELAALDAQRATLPRGAHLRRAWAGAKLPRPIPGANVDALGQLRGLASNLNQLARHANQSGQVELAELAATVAGLRATLAGLA
jgi:hypothetical protein